MTLLREEASHGDRDTVGLGEDPLVDGDAMRTAAERRPSWLFRGERGRGRGRRSGGRRRRRRRTRKPTPTSNCTASTRHLQYRERSPGRPRSTDGPAHGHTVRSQSDVSMTITYLPGRPGDHPTRDVGGGRVGEVDIGARYSSTASAIPLAMIC